MNFPFICSNIPAAHAHGIYISQLIRYSRACGSYQDFLDSGLLLTRKLPRIPFGKVEVITSKVLWPPPWLGWPLWNICVTSDHGYVPLVVSTSRSFPHSRLITEFITRLTWRVPLVEQEQHTLPEHLSSPPVFSGVGVTRSLVLCLYFVDRCSSFFTFSFGHCIVCPSSIYRFWLPPFDMLDIQILITSLWYLQTLLAILR